MATLERQIEVRFIPLPAEAAQARQEALCGFLVRGALKLSRQAMQKREGSGSTGISQVQRNVSEEAQNDDL